MNRWCIWREPLIYCGDLLVIARARDQPVGFQSICSVEFKANASHVCSSAWSCYCKFAKLCELWKNFSGKTTTRNNWLSPPCFCLKKVEVQLLKWRTLTCRWSNFCSLGLVLFPSSLLTASNSTFNVTKCGLYAVISLLHVSVNWCEVKGLTVCEAECS